MDSKSLSEKVYDDIKEKILNLTWPMGQRLTENEIAKSLHVSRTPVRAALFSLYNEGLLSYNKNIGYSVKVVTVDDVEEIYKIRKALDLLAFKEAAMNMSDEDFNEINRLVDSGKRAIKNNDVDELIKSSLGYNKMIYQFAKMPRVKTIQDSLMDYLEIFRILSFGGEYNERRKQAIKEHEEMLIHMKRKDFDKLEDLLIIHLDTSKNYILTEAEGSEDYIYDDDY